MSDDLRARMSESDAAHWGGIRRWRDVQMHPIRPRVISQRIRSAALAPLGKAVPIAHKIPGDEALTRTVSSVAPGLVELAAFASGASVHRKCILEAYRSAGFDVRTPQDIRSLTLDDVLTVKPRLSPAYSATAAAEDAVSSVFASGGSAAAVLDIGMASTPGVSVTASTITADITSFLAAAARLVTHTAAYYGYDSKDPTERPFSTMVLSQTIDPTGSGCDLVIEKQTMMLAFNKMMHGLAWRGSFDGLDSNVIVSAMNSLFSAMSMRLASRKLAQIAPVAGIAVSVGPNTALMRTIGETAGHLYRERFLAERYSRVEPGNGASTGLVRPADTQELSADITRYVEIAEAESRPQGSGNLAPAVP